MERNRPVAQILLTDDDYSKAMRVAAKRNRWYAGIHENLKIKDYATTQRIAASLLAEIAFCRLYGLKADMRSGKRLPHYDTVGSDGRTIDVKFRTTDYADMVIPLNLFIENHADYFALMTGYKLLYKMWGFASFHDVFQPQYYNAFVPQPCIVYPACALRRNVYPLK